MRFAYLRVGLLILGAVGVVIGAIFFLTGERLAEGARYETYFTESVQGLNVGAPVKFRGVTLGQVTEIGLTSAAYTRDATAPIREADYRLVYVRFVIDPKRVGRLPTTDTAVQTGLRTRLASQGLTGLAYIEIDFVDPGANPAMTLPWEPRDPVIPSVPSTLLQVQTAAEQLLAKLNGLDLGRITNDLDGLLTDVRHQIGEGDLHALLVSAGGATEALRGAVERADLPGLSADLREAARAARETLQGRDTRAILANAAAASARLPALADALAGAVRQADNGVADVRAALGPLLRDARAAVANLREASDTLRRYPASALLGGAPPRPER